jgi:pyrimidine deaminase RibD-like protein
MAPCREGCIESAVLGTTSAVAVSADDAVAAAVGEGVKELLGRKVEVKVGRRGERHENVLRRWDSLVELKLC